MFLHPKSKKRKFVVVLMVEELLLERLERVKALAEKKGAGFSIEKDFEKHLAAQISRAEHALEGTTND